MGSQLNYFSENFQASTDLSAVPQRFVTITTAGVVRLAQTGEYAEGVLENIPDVAMPATVSFTGITKVQVDGAYPIGTYIVPGTDGVGTVYTAPTATYIRGKLLEASGASGDIVMIRLIDDVVATGMIGPTGATGVKGSTGIQGGTGIQGQTGVQGQTGIQGGTGIQGQTGIRGITTGATGAGTTPAGTVAVNIGGVDMYLLYSAGA